MKTNYRNTDKKLYDNKLDRTDRLIYEEAGSSKKLIKAWVQGDSLTNVGGYKLGTKIALGCVCAGTKVWTKDGRHINIEDLQQSDGIIGFHQGASYPENIQWIKTPEEVSCVRINTDYGSLECSLDHPIFTRIQHSKRDPENYNGTRERWYDYQWINAKDVDSWARNSVIGICDKIEVWGDTTDDDPYMLGLLIGDGSYGFNKTPRLSNCDKEIWNYIESKYVCKLDRPSKLTKDQKEYKEMRILNITAWLRQVGIYGQVKTNKRLPINYMQYSKEAASLLLAGLFDTDGTFVEKRNKSTAYIGITQSSIEILEQIKELLRKFGIFGYITKVSPNIKEGRKDRNSWYTFTIADQISIVNFYENIPIKIEYKKNKLQKIANVAKHGETYKRYNTIVGIREAHVINVEYIGKKLVYNLTADDMHTYLANEFITHNTGK